MFFPERVMEIICRGISAHVLRDNMYILNTDVRQLRKFLQILSKHNNLQYKQLMDMVCVDKLVGAERFEVTYVLLNLKYKSRIFIKIFVSQGQAIPSIGDMFDSANWLEREVWDMFGVVFENHNDLRRILTDYGFEGHPLRKSFPLMGYMEIRYDEQDKRIVFEPVSFMQEYRKFEFLRSWD
jgi:NADH-quinone oxidoreductase subunit C